MRNNYKEYVWKDVKTDAHNYIFPAIIKLLKDLRLPLNAQILDAGCGAGNLVNELYKIGYKNVYGFDASESGIELAKNTFSQITNNFFKHNVYELNLPLYVPQKYVLIISVEVIEHLYNPQSYLKNIYSWLNRDGYLILTTPYHGYFKNFAIALLDRFDRHVDSLQENGHIKFFSRKTLTALLNSSGFKVISFSGAGRIPCFWKSMVVLGKKNE